MTTSPAAAAPHAVTGPSALTGRDFVLLLAAIACAFGNFAPLLPVLPLWSASGGTGHGGLGAITGTQMGATVAVQVLMPWLLARFGARRVLAAGALLLGAPALAYAASPDLPWVLAVTVVRGAGFGMVVVSGSALVAELIPAGQRGRAVGLYGAAVGLPQVIAMPLGVWSAHNIGFVPVFAAAAALSMLGAPLALSIRRPRAAAEGGGSGRGSERGWPALSTLRAVAPCWVVLLGSASAMGGVTAFLALALADPRAAPAALFVLPLSVVAGRWGAGVWADRRGPGRLVLPGLLAGVLGMAGFAAAAGAGLAELAIAVVAAAVYGVGLGAVQNDTLVVMFRRAGPRGGGGASTVWNIGNDTGLGVGSVLVGVIAMGLGIAGAFAATAAAMLLIAPLAWAETRRAGAAEERHPA